MLKIVKWTSGLDDKDNVDNGEDVDDDDDDVDDDGNAFSFSSPLL